MAKRRHPIVRCDKLWDSPSGQFFSCDDGRISVSRLIDLSKDFEVFDLPLAHMDLSQSKTFSMIEFVSHVRMVMDADLKYPIILDHDGVIADGRHRVLKALFLEKRTIKAVRFDYPIPLD